MRYLKYMPFHSMAGASRNRRELETALEMGYEVSVFSGDRSKDGLCLPEEVKLIYDGTEKFSAGLPKWKRILKILHNRWRILCATRKLDVDAMSCHDLLSLKMAYVATLLKRNKPKLIYDSHEFELGRNTTGKRSAAAGKLIAWQERFLMKRCAFSIMVNDSIADEVQRIHKLKNRPVVVRSTPDYWEIDETACREKRRQFLEVFSALG